jgi:AcrR family transcriptional regulator
VCRIPGPLAFRWPGVEVLPCPRRPPSISPWLPRARAVSANLPADRSSGPFAFRPDPTPPLALARLPAGRHGLPREFIEENQRNRLMAGAIDVLGERGYLDSTVDAICSAAGASSNTFYAQFDDKEACFLAAYDVTLAWLTDEASRSVAAADDWPRQVQAAVAGTLELLASDPRLARLCTVEIFLTGAAADARHRQLVDRLSLPLGVGRGERALGADLPLQLEPTLIGGAISLIARYVNSGDGDRLAELVPGLVEYLLSPYLGVAAAQKVVADGG